MKNRKKLALAVGLASAVGSFVAPANADTECTETSTYNLHTGANSSDPNGSDGYCSLDPINMLLTFYEFGLCAGPSDPSDKSLCVPLFQSDTGIEFDFSVGSSAPLISDVTLPEGVFTNAYIVLSNWISLNTSQQFASPRTDSHGGTGTYCFTNGLNMDAGDGNMTCANTSSPEHSAMRIRFSAGGAYSNAQLDYEAEVAGTTTITDLYMITSSGNLSSDGQDFAVYADQTLDQPVTISPDTQDIDLGISVTNGALLSFIQSGADNYIEDAMINGVKILVRAN